LLIVKTEIRIGFGIGLVLDLGFMMSSFMTILLPVVLAVVVVADIVPVEAASGRVVLIGTIPVIFSNGSMSIMILWSVAIMSTNIMTSMECEM